MIRQRKQDSREQQRKPAGPKAPLLDQRNTQSLAAVSESDTPTLDCLYAIEDQCIWGSQEQTGWQRPTADHDVDAVTVEAGWGWSNVAEALGMDGWQELREYHRTVNNVTALHPNMVITAVPADYQAPVEEAESPTPGGLAPELQAVIDRADERENRLSLDNFHQRPETEPALSNLDENELPADLQAVVDRSTERQSRLSLDNFHQRPQPGRTAPYLNQRDNVADGLGRQGNAQCMPTSTAMLVLSEMDEAEVRPRAVALLEQAGKGPLPATLQQTDEIVNYVGIAFYGAAEWRMLYTHRMLLQQFSGVRYEDMRWSAANQAEQIRTVNPPAYVSTNMTGSGHIVVMVDRLSGGIVINDPNGANTGEASSYVKNGQAQTQDQLVPDHRFRFRPDLAEVPVGTVRNDWGERLFFTWEEVDAMDVGMAVMGRSDEQLNDNDNVG
jgi:hypothetical protein